MNKDTFNTPPKKKRTWLPWLKRIGIAFLIIIIIAVAWFFIYALDVTKADPTPYNEALKNPAVSIQSNDKYITIRPTKGYSDTGLIFYSGAKVEPEAYVSKLATISEEANIQIVIGRPTLNLAYFSINQADDLYGALPDVKNWYVGGHSLGGSMACVYASSHTEKLKGVILLGTYCGVPISNTSLKVLSINGDQDGVFPPKAIAEKRFELPKTAQMVKVSGMSHAQIGNYGLQSGDNNATISDADARQALVNATKSFFLNE